MDEIEDHNLERLKKRTLISYQLAQSYALGLKLEGIKSDVISSACLVFAPVKCHVLVMWKLRSDVPVVAARQLQLRDAATQPRDHLCATPSPLNP